MKKKGKVMPGSLAKIRRNNEEIFEMVSDLRVMTIPHDYNHDTEPAYFSVQENICSSFADELYLFEKSSERMQPNQMYRVRIFEQMEAFTMSVNFAKVFVAAEKAIFSGKRGTMVLLEEVVKSLPEDKLYLSFDPKEMILNSVSGMHSVPIFSTLGGKRSYETTYLERTFEKGLCLVCFIPVPRLPKPQQ